MLDVTPLPHYFSEEHRTFRAALCEFVRKEITPFVNEWDEAGAFPRELCKKAAEVGLLGIGYAEEYGGIPADLFFLLIAAEEIAYAGSGGLQASLCSHTIGAPPIAALGSAELKQRVLPSILSGDKISALAISEPGGGSDVAALKTTAVRDGDHYIVNGEKIFITSGIRADYLTVAVRTDPVAKGAAGLSLLVIEGNTPGLTRSPLDKMGWWCSDTALLHFADCRVPVANLIGVEGQGFKAIAHNFNNERLVIAVSACAFAQVCLDEAIAWARERKTFGATLIERQVIRHKLVDMAMRIDTARSYVYELAYRIQSRLGDPATLVAKTCMAKIHATQTMQFCADQAVQILGGMGYMRGTRSERIYREAKVMMIGGGSEEIMKDLVAKQLGF